MRIFRILGPSLSRIDDSGDVLLLRPSSGCKIDGAKKKLPYYLTDEKILRIPAQSKGLSLHVEEGSTVDVLWLYKHADIVND